ncbi:hypothetical protein QNI16_11735 [Cytophagaceae bacterium YF14B1]|uniref:Uncharacterized protein n=1 Tax=Xanthocytophaga flava TaxID=3048013 RepID=A0AAE3U8G2_9BACT|nr:hypothetical protein [Xanthocytophaga flavus]MDJ1481158.1 hypothetical protein [Xanthocytophaga flavus]
MPVQDSSTAVVTKIEQIVRLSPTVRSMLSEESFPDYISLDPKLQAGIVSSVKSAVSRKFGVKEVVINQSAGNWLDFRNIAAPVQVDVNRGNGTVYIAIQQVIQLTTTSADTLGMTIKNFMSTCSILAQDKDGKTLFTSKLIQPFSTANRAGQVYGLVEISAEDWGKLLTNAINTGFENTNKRLPHQTFYRPATEVSAYGLTGASPRFYILQETEKTASSFKGSNREKIISFRQSGRVPRVWQFSQSYSLSENYLRGEYRTRILLNDKAFGTEYEITVTSNVTKDSTNIYSRNVSPIQIRCTAQRLLVGDYTLSEKRFEGQVGYDVFAIRAVPPRNTFEVTINDKVKALIQRGGIRNQNGQKRLDTYTFISREMDDNMTDKIFLSYLIFQIANELGRDFLGY